MILNETIIHQNLNGVNKSQHRQPYGRIFRIVGSKRPQHKKNEAMSILKPQKLKHYIVLNLCDSQFHIKNKYEHTK